MENSSSSTTHSQSSWIIVAVVIIVAIAAITYFYQRSTPEPITVVTTPEPITETQIEETIEAPIVETELVEPAALVEEATIEETPEIVPVPEKVLPALDESDSWIREKLPTVTWRKELLKLIIDDDMIRRFVVFTDNFAKGTLAYEHSLLIKPTTTFSAQENQLNGETTLVWDESVSKRFGVYVELLRSIDNDLLIQWYSELKPLINEAYSELGYPDEEFTDVFQEAITRVLDMEIPKEPPVLVRPSVMYKYQDSDIEALSDADKLLLRLGKDNLLVIKSVLLEINEKLSRTRE